MTVKADQRVAEVDAIFEKWDRDDSPGMAVGVYQGGEIVLAKGYGMASLELGVPITPASVFHVASVSKQFCAISVALLAEESDLDLDGDIRTWIPEMPDLGYTITPRQLIHHTNGLRDQYGLFRLAGWREGDAQEFNDVLDFAWRHSRLNFEPQSQYAYCNTSYTLLALIVSRVSGKSLRDYANEKIFEPLGMTGSSFMDNRSEVVRNRANAYAPRDDDGFKTLNSNVDALGAICLYTCVDDQLRWLKNFSERTVAGSVLDDATTSAVLSSGEPTCYGYGLALETYRGLRTVGHGGVDSGYRAQIIYFPEADFGVVILANLSSVKPSGLAHKVADIYLEEQLGSRGIADEPAIDISDEDLNRLTGIYIQPETKMVRTIERSDDGPLKLVTGFGPDLDLTPVGPNRFWLDEPAWELRFNVSDERISMEEIATSGRRSIYEQVDEVSPEPADLAAYVGSYYCREIDATHRVYLKDGQLCVKQRKTEEQKLRPATADTFNAGMNLIVFQRDAHNDVSGFQLFNDRIRYLQFDRL